MRALLLCAVIASTGCSIFGLGSSGFEFRDPSCSDEVPELARDLTWHLMQDSERGSFDYWPGGSVLIRIEGDYDLSTGDFAWVERAAAESFMHEITVEGFGYADPNGDLDIIGTRTVLDALDIEQQSQFRIERTGCVTENRVRFTNNFVERESVESGIYLPGRYAYTQVTDIDGNPYVVEGERRLDRTFTEELTFAQEGYTLNATREGDLDAGTVSRTYRETFAQGAREGTEDRRLDGSRVVSFTQVTNQGTTVWNYEVDYAGDGSGTVTGAGFSCELTFVRNDCTFDCGGQQGRC